jgi:hypothetical protein
LPSASEASVVRTPFIAHEVHLALRSRCVPDAVASTASRPASMTMANAPLWDGTAVDIEVIWVRREQKYFCKRGWTGFTDLPVGQSAPPLLELRRTQAEGVTRVLIVGERRMALIRPPHYV